MYTVMYTVIVETPYPLQNVDCDPSVVDLHFSLGYNILF